MPREPQPRPVAIRAEPIELSAFLKFAGAFQTGGEAKHAVLCGKVLVNGEPEGRRGRKLVAGDTVTLEGERLLVELDAGAGRKA